MMIFAQIEYEREYSEFHAELVSFVEEKFSNVEFGLQGDSWIWIYEKDEKVAIDTFSSMKHQVKTPNPGSDLVGRVIKYLASKYRVVVYETPEFEAHE